MNADPPAGTLKTNEEWCEHYGLNPSARSHAEAYLVVVAGGQVKLGRFTPEKDPDAPALVVVGGGKGTIRRAETAINWRSPFPVILKSDEKVDDKTPLWAFGGRWRIVGGDLHTESGRREAFASAEWRRSDEHPPIGVLYLEQTA